MMRMLKQPEKKTNRLSWQKGSVSVWVLFLAGALGLVVLLWTWRPVTEDGAEGSNGAQSFTASQGSSAAPIQGSQFKEKNEVIRQVEQGMEGHALSPVDSTLMQTRTREWLKHVMSTDFIENGLDSPARVSEALESIRSAGPYALAEIRDFLEESRDLPFPEGHWQSVGFRSLRAALFDMLHRVGGLEGEGILLQTLRSTADPREIGQLAGYLGDRPEFREEILSSARETLQEITKPGLRPEEAGPLFDVLRKFGDERVVEDLRKALPQWSHYAAIAIAGLPEGQGIRPLLEEAQNPAQRKPAHYLLTFQLLAQNSHHQEAAQGLVQMAREGRILPQAWSQIAQGLTSAQEYEFGNADEVRRTVARSEADVGGWKKAKVGNTGQNFFSRPLHAENDAALIESRLLLLDQLVSVTSDPKALESLQAASQVLTSGRGGISSQR
jgi:hypothetical protein